MIEYDKMNKQEAKTIAPDGVMIRLSPNSTLQGVIGNLYYYGFIDDQEAFEKLLTETVDKTPGNENSIKAGENTIDVNSSYSLNYSMSDEEIADTLLNKAEFVENFNRYNYLFMPGSSESSENFSTRNKYTNTVDILSLRV